LRWRPIIIENDVHSKLIGVIKIRSINRDILGLDLGLLNIPGLFLSFWSLLLWFYFWHSFSFYLSFLLWIYFNLLYCVNCGNCSCFLFGLLDLVDPFFAKALASFTDLFCGISGSMFLSVHEPFVAKEPVAAERAQNKEE